MQTLSSRVFSAFVCLFFNCHSSLSSHWYLVGSISSVNIHRTKMSSFTNMMGMTAIQTVCWRERAKQRSLKISLICPLQSLPWLFWVIYDLSKFLTERIGIPRCLPSLFWHMSCDDSLNDLEVSGRQIHTHS